MSEYTHAIDMHITQTLQLRGHVMPDMLAGVDETDAREMLRHYASAHADRGDLAFDGSRLSVKVAAVPPAESPVFTVPIGPSLLDSGPAEPFSRWIWALPLSFGLLGGVIGWFVLKDRNRGGARGMMFAGAAVSVMSVVVGFMFAGSMVTGFGGASASVTWPASPYGNPSLYYFGTST